MAIIDLEQIARLLIFSHIALIANVEIVGSGVLAIIKDLDADRSSGCAMPLAVTVDFLHLRLSLARFRAQNVAQAGDDGQLTDQQIGLKSDLSAECVVFLDQLMQLLSSLCPSHPFRLRRHTVFWRFIEQSPWFDISSLIKPSYGRAGMLALSEPDPPSVS